VWLLRVRGNQNRRLNRVAYGLCPITENHLLFDVGVFTFVENIKGTAILSRLKYLEAKASPEVRENVINALSHDFQEAIKNKILISQWYPFRYYIELIQAIDNVMGNGDLQTIVEVGTFLAEYVLKEVYLTFRKSTPERGMPNIPIMWKQYYKGNGRILLSYIAPKLALVKGIHFELGGDEFALAMAGFNKGYLECCGGKNVQVEIYQPEVNENWGYYISWE
jgi:hypothetical protein